MKQRLAIAASLLAGPALLILDEPTNGLDSAGIVEMRSLVRSLADEGMTVFVSSHLLSEIEHTPLSRPWWCSPGRMSRPETSHGTLS